MRARVALRGSPQSPLTRPRASFHPPPTRRVLALVAEKSAPGVKNVADRLRAQRSPLLAHVKLRVAQIEAEERHQREEEARIQAEKDEAERERMRQAETERKREYERRQDIQRQLRRVGVCSAGYAWSPRPHPRYQCEGGSHWVTLRE